MAEKTIQDQINKTTKEIDKATEKLNPAFTKLVDNLSETNRELAKEVAGIRLSAKNTFAGALQANKFNKLGNNLSTFLKEGEKALDPKQFKQLKDAMGEMDLKGFEELNQKVIEHEKDIIDLETKKAKRLDEAEKEGNSLWEAEQDIQAQKKKLNKYTEAGIDEQSVGYQKEFKKLQELQTAGEERRKSLTAFADAEIKEKSDLLDEELKERQEFNDQAIKSFRELNENAGKLGKFTDGIRDLTGIDLGGMIDGMMSKVNSIGKVLTLGKEDNMSGVLIEKLTEGFSKLGDAMGNSLAMFAGAAGSEAVGKRVGEDIAGIWKKGLTDPMEKSSEAIGKAGKKGLKSVQGIWKKKPEQMEMFAEEEGKFGAAWGKASKTISNSAKAFGTMARGWWKSFKGLMSKAWTNITQWKIATKMQSVYNFAYMKTFKKWIATGWQWLMSTKIFTGLQSILNAARKSAFAAWLAVMWKDVIFMIKQTGKMIVLAAGKMVAWAANMVAQIINIAALLIPILPIIAIALAVVALAALLIWGGMKLYESSELFRSYIDMVVGYFKDVANIIGDIFGGFYDFFAGLFTGDWDRMFGGLKDIFGGLWDLMLAPFNAVFDWLKETFGFDLGGMITKLARKILPNWALNLLGLGGTEETDKLQEALVPEREGRKEDRALRESAEESGLYEYNARGESVVDQTKVGNASDEQLEAIIRHGDISNDQKMMLLQELKSRSDVGAENPSVGDMVGEASVGTEAATQAAGDITVNSNVQTDNSTRNKINLTQDAKETDRSLLGTSGLIPILEN